MPKYKDECPYKFEPQVRAGHESLLTMRAQNNPDKAPVGKGTGRCHHCGSVDLWKGETVTGCNTCLAMLDTRMSVVIMAEEQAIAVTPNKRMACVSISNPGQPVPIQNGWGKLLRLEFADAEYVERDIIFYAGMWKFSSRGFVTKHHALQSIKFIDELCANKDNFDILVIHCGAGVSRSAALARYAANRLGVELNQDSKRFNRTYARLLDNPTLFDGLLPIEEKAIIEKLKESTLKVITTLLPKFRGMAG